MKPVSIQRFSQCLLASAGVSLVQAWIGFDHMREAAAANPEAVAINDEALIAGNAIGIGVLLLLWFLIAMRASSVARWVLVALTAIGLLAVPGELAKARADGGLDLALAIAALTLQLAAVGLLFTGESRNWLAGRSTGEGHGPAGGDLGD